MAKFVVLLVSLFFCGYFIEDSFSQSSKGDLGIDDRYMLAPKQAKTFIRERRWKIKSVWGESKREKKKKQRRQEQAREAQERVYEADRDKQCTATCWSGWGGFGACSGDCGRHGLQHRYRYRVTPNGCQGRNYPCPGGTTDSRTCTSPCQNSGTATGERCACPPQHHGKCCEKKHSCSGLGAFDHGAVSPHANNYAYGQVVTFTCHRGYNLHGHGKLTCGASVWNHPKPQCVIVSCGNPGVPAHGSVSGAGTYVYGSLLKFSCKDGFNLLGDSKRQCLESGKWSGTQPTCRQITCPAPPVVANGKSSVSSGHNYGSKLTYTCNTGYAMKGASTSVCQGQGVWSGAPPTCNIVTCPAIATPKNSKISFTKDRRYGSVASVTCNSGYKIKGDAKRTCSQINATPNGQWSGSPAECEIMSCPDPGIPANGVRKNSVFTYGSRVTYDCNPGHEMHGVSEIVCQADTKWSAARPTCSPCPRGSYRYVEQKAKCISCPANSNTAGTGSNSITMCVCNTSYRGPPGGPCNLITCPNKMVPQTTQNKCVRTFHGKCEYTCVSGYVWTKGDAYLTCGADSTWIGNDKVCKPCPKNMFKAKEEECAYCPSYRHTPSTGSNLNNCVCDSGFKETSRDPSTPCIDIDECATKNAGCQQICINTLGSYECTCYQNYLPDEADPSRCVGKNACPEITRPDNGGFVCSANVKTSTQHCQSRCNLGYEHGARPNIFEQCGPSTNFQWSYQIKKVSIPACIPQFFPGMEMETDVFYFVSSCKDLTPGQLEDAKAQLLAEMTKAGICRQDGIFACSIQDMTVQCGTEVPSDPFWDEQDWPFSLLSRKVGPRVRISLKFALPGKARAKVDCNVVCPSGSYCDSKCIGNYAESAERSLMNAAGRLSDHLKKTKLRVSMKPEGVIVHPVEAVCPGSKVVYRGTCVTPCGTPITPVHGHTQGEPWLYGAEAAYQC